MSLAATFLFMTAVNSGIVRGQSGCAAIEQGKRQQYIVYDGVAGTKAKVRLRLRNNSSCAILIIVAENPRRLIKSPTIRFEEITGGVDGVQVDPYYLVHSRYKETLKARGWGDYIVTHEILSGQSVVFGVPVSIFRKRLDVAVPFNYRWESDLVTTGTGGVMHQVYFLFDDVPDARFKSN